VLYACVCYMFRVFVPPALMDALHALRCHIHASLDGTPITDAPYPLLDGRKPGVACMRSRLASKLVDYGIGVLRVVE
jgi:hypothetical protein